MTDIVERLKDHGMSDRGSIARLGTHGMIDLILQQRAEIERLRAALEEIAEDYETYEFWTDDNGGYSKPTHDPEILRRARRALGGKDDSTG